LSKGLYSKGDGFMATIKLYADKINQMPGLIKDVKKSVIDYKSELAALQKKSLSIRKDICNMDDVISSLQTSTQTQEEKLDSLETLSKNVEQFIDNVVRIDNEVADLVKQRKDEFFDKYSRLKPDCERSDWDKFKAGCKSVVDWCKDNWKSIGKILITVVIIAAIGIASVLTGGILGVILAGAFWGALSGALIGGAAGGITAAMNGGSFLDGFADGALSGAVIGGITGAAFSGIGVLGAAFGSMLKCGTKLANVVKMTSRTTKVLSIGMDGFDMLTMGAGLFDPSSAWVKANQKLHSSTLYNGLQIGANALAIFSGGAKSTMVCFVAGTMILTAKGLVAIERIKAGDRIISTNVETMESGEKAVLQTFINESKELTHVFVNDEEITATPNHLFYVADKGWIPAAKLSNGNVLMLSNANQVEIERVTLERLEEPVKVYNFEVEDWHTYHVGNISILVHNDCDVTISRSRHPESAKHIENAIADGQPDTLTIDRPGATARRTQSLKGKPKVPGYDLDEYPPAVFKEGGVHADGTRSSVRAIPSSDNRGSGSSLGHQLRGQPEGAKVTYKIVP
jgi:hypothetical protein